LLSYLEATKELIKHCIHNTVTDELFEALDNFKTHFFICHNNFTLSMTLKIHVIIDHFRDYFEFTGETFRNTNGEFGESAHSSIRK
jgi:GH43 family beta-xylosidase